MSAPTDQSYEAYHTDYTEPKLSSGIYFSRNHSEQIVSSSSEGANHTSKEMELVTKHPTYPTSSQTSTTSSLRNFGSYNQTYVTQRPSDQDNELTVFTASENMSSASTARHDEDLQNTVEETNAFENVRATSRDLSLNASQLTTDKGIATGTDLSVRSASASSVHPSSASRQTVGPHDVVLRSTTVEHMVQTVNIVCTYHRIHANWSAGNTLYNLDTFPYDYCTSVLYCCVGLDADLNVERVEEQHDFKLLVMAKLKYPGLRTYLALGGNGSYSESFRRLTSSTIHQDIFVQIAVHWLRTRGFDGLYIYWTYPRKEDKLPLIQASKRLMASFRWSKLSYGLVLPSHERLQEGFDIRSLVQDPDVVSADVLLSPLEDSDYPFNDTWLSTAEAIVGRIRPSPKENIRKLGTDLRVVTLCRSFLQTQ